MSQFSAAAAYNITCAAYVSDYSRCLPRDIPRGKIIGYVFAGASTPVIWLIETVVQRCGFRDGGDI
jgi:nucleobase:cation symporter-1, NCS1 family